MEGGIKMWLCFQTTGQLTDWYWLEDFILMQCRSTWFLHFARKGGLLNKVYMGSSTQPRGPALNTVFQEKDAPFVASFGKSMAPAICCEQF